MADLSTTHTRSEVHTSELQSRVDVVCRLLLEKKKEVEAGPGWAEWLCGLTDEKRATKLVIPAKPRTHGEVRELAGVGPVLRRDFFLNEAATDGIYTLSLHDALPI